MKKLAVVLIVACAIVILYGCSCSCLSPKQSKSRTNNSAATVAASITNTIGTSEYLTLSGTYVANESTINQVTMTFGNNIVEASDQTSGKKTREYRIDLSAGNMTLTNVEKGQEKVYGFKYVSEQDCFTLDSGDGTVATFYKR